MPNIGVETGANAVGDSCDGDCENGSSINTFGLSPKHRTVRNRTRQRYESFVNTVPLKLCKFSLHHRRPISTPWHANTTTGSCINGGSSTNSGGQN